MTQFLRHLFVKNAEKTDDPKVRADVGRLSSLVGIICNLVLFGAKLLVGMLAGSVSVTADAMNNLSDSTSALVTLIGFRLAERPADADHPYGHARYEYLSGLTVAALILIIGVELLTTSWDKIWHPVKTEFSVLTLAVLVCSILVKLWMALFNRKLGRMIHSTALLATSADSRNDVITTGAVLAAAVFAKCTHIEVDGYIGMAVAIFILISGVSMAKDTISPLLGEAADPQLRHDIVKELRSNEKVLGIHDLMVHDYGPGQRFASVHVEMDVREDPMVCHDIIDELERRCMETLRVHLVIHYDPVVTNDAELNRMRALVTKTLAAQDSRLTVHDFRMIRGSSANKLIFDVGLPFELQDREDYLKETIDAAIAAEEEKPYITMITFDTM